MLLDAAAGRIAAGRGPVALDAERASGYRYGQRAYLVQLRREGSGTWLIDPIACPDLEPLAEAIGAAEWILHAATQDLACLAEVGLRPRQLFDTELAARILGLPRVGLAAVVEHYLGLSLAKEHSAVDWSTRPLPTPWLRYAALDVEVLTDLRNLMGVDLAAQGKAEWARQEFAALLDWEPAEPAGPVASDDAGCPRSRGGGPRASSVSCGTTRDDIARERDVSPGRVLPDRVAHRHRGGRPDVDRSPAVGAPGDPAVQPAVGRGGHPGPGPARGGAAPRARSAATAPHRPGPGPRRTPSPRSAWRTTRAALTAFAAEHTIPVENVCSPEPLRRVVWTPADRGIPRRRSPRRSSPRASVPGRPRSSRRCWWRPSAPAGLPGHTHE